MGICVLFTLNSYSQDADLYYTVDDYNSVSDTDTIVEETDTYITNNYYNEYPTYSNRIRRFYSDFWYVSYWSLSNKVPSIISSPSSIFKGPKTTICLFSSTVAVIPPVIVS